MSTSAFVLFALAFSLTMAFYIASYFVGQRMVKQNKPLPQQSVGLRLGIWWFYTLAHVAALSVLFRYLTQPGEPLASIVSGYGGLATGVVLITWIQVLFPNSRFMKEKDREQIVSQVRLWFNSGALLLFAYLLAATITA